ncbi:MAG: hypothetical protein MHM6MM_008163 [Cercozoa sp. M6MM]
MVPHRGQCKLTCETDEALQCTAAAHEQPLQRLALAARRAHAAESEDRVKNRYMRTSICDSFKRSLIFSRSSIHSDVSGRPAIAKMPWLVTFNRLDSSMQLVTTR